MGKMVTKWEKWRRNGRNGYEMGEMATKWEKWRRKNHEKITYVKIINIYHQGLLKTRISLNLSHSLFLTLSLSLSPIKSLRRYLVYSQSYEC